MPGTDGTVENVAYENLLKSVEESAAEREAELRSRAAAAARGILAEAEGRASRLQQAQMDEAVRSAGIERNRQLYLVRAEKKRELIRYKETVLEKALDDARRQLAGLRDDPAYPEVFSGLAAEAAAAFGTRKCIAHVDKKDEALAKTTLGKIGLSATVAADIATAGGLVLSTPDGSVTIRNTVESRLERIAEHRRLEIAQILFAG